MFLCQVLGSSGQNVCHLWKEAFVKRVSQSMCGEWEGSRTSKAWSSWFISLSWFPLEKCSSALTVRSPGLCCRALSRASSAWHGHTEMNIHTKSTPSPLLQLSVLLCKCYHCWFRSGIPAGSTKRPLWLPGPLNHECHWRRQGWREEEEDDNKENRNLKLSRKVRSTERKSVII